MRLYSLLVASIVLLSACGGTSENGTEEANDSTNASTGIVSQGEVIDLPSGVKIEVSQKGDGIKPQQGQKVAVHYKGMLENGQVFDESYQRGEPISFKIGTGQVIPGWDQGIAQLSKGAKARLTIPANMAYGPNERPGIPANSTLVFDVEVMDIMEGPKPITHEPFKTEGMKPMTTASGLKVFMIEEGKGKAAAPGTKVKVHYYGALENGQKFDSSYERGEPIEFMLGQGQVIPGWEEGIAMLTEGSKAKFIIPPSLAYGEKGAGGVIPPNATLMFDVELIAVQ